MSLKKVFKFTDVNNFDNHISVSIPDYAGLSRIFTALALEFVQPEGVMIDVGCSTGKFLSGVPKVAGAKYIGVDVVDILEHEIKFEKRKASDFLGEVESADLVCAMFALQFMDKRERGKVLDQLVRLNQSGAAILISEKVYLDKAQINQTLHREHIREKRGHFSDSEILDKDYDLLGSMFCKGESEIIGELSRFRSVTQVWQSYNFKGWCLL